MRGGLSKSKCSKVYHTMTRCERISNILYKKLLENSNTIMHFDLNVSKDWVLTTAVCVLASIRCELLSKPIAEFFAFSAFEFYFTELR